MTEVRQGPQVDRGYFSETHAQIASHAKLLSEAIGESTPTGTILKIGRRRMSYQKRGVGAHRAFATPGDDRVLVSVGYAGPVVDRGETVDSQSRATRMFGLRIGDSDQVVRKAKHIEEKLGGRAVRDAGIILYELARQEGRLSKTTLRKAETVLDIASTSVTDDQQRNRVVTLPDASTGKMVQVFTEDRVTGPRSGMDKETRQALIDKAKQVMASVRHVMGTIPDQAIEVKIEHHHGQEMAYVQSANGDGTQGTWVVLSDVNEAEMLSASTPEQDGIGQRDTVKIGADTVARKFNYLPPEKSDHIKDDELVVVIPGWSMPYGTKPIQKLAQEYANQGNMEALVVNARVDSVVGEDDLFLRAQAIADLIIKKGVKEVTITGHSQGGTQAADVAYILQTMREEQILRGIEPTIPTVKGLILHDPVGLYDQDWRLLAGNFLLDAGKTFFEAAGEQNKYSHAKFARNNAAEWEGDEQQPVSDRPIMHNAGEGAAGKAIQAGNAIVAGAVEEAKESGRQYLQRTIGEIKGMANVPLDRKERLAALKVPVVIITGENDPISRPEKFVPKYETFNWENAILPDPDSETGGLYNVRERQLQESFFTSAPYVRMVTARRFGHHGGPLGQPEKQARVGRALVDRAQHPELRSTAAYTPAHREADRAAWEESRRAVEPADELVDINS